MRALPFFSVSLALALAGCPAEPGPGDAGGPGVDAPFDAGPCATDSDCPGSYCNPGSHACCVPASPPYEICGDFIDQNCDRRDVSCGDTDDDAIQACRPGESPTSGCDCDDERADVRPRLGTVAGAPELCDGADNDCNGRIDESAECCAGCASLGANRDRADICTDDGTCDCSSEDGLGPCAEGMTCCASGCTDTDTDVMNCGFCNSMCTVSADSCVAGGCSCGGGPPCDLDAACSGGACPMM